MTWLTWLTFGFILLIAELIIPSGFFLITIGLAGLTVGALLWLGVGGPWWIAWVIFVVLSIVYYIAGVTKLKSCLFRNKRVDDNQTIGQIVTLTSDINPGDVGQVELWGSSWRAKNTGSSPMKSGEKAKVSAVEGVTLSIEALH